MRLERERPGLPYLYLPEVMQLSLSVDGVREGGMLSKPQMGASHGGSDLNPMMEWSGAPEETQSFALSCFDVDAPAVGGMWHWMVIDVPAEVSSVEEGADFSRIEGARVMTNGLGVSGFSGATPPPGDHEHRYLFTVHALPVAKLPVPAEASCSVVSFYLEQMACARQSVTLTAFA